MVAWMILSSWMGYLLRCFPTWMMWLSSLISGWTKFTSTNCMDFLNHWTHLQYSHAQVVALHSKNKCWFFCSILQIVIHFGEFQTNSMFQKAPPMILSWWCLKFVPYPQFIQWPSDYMLISFEQFCKIRNIMGAINGIHIKISWSSHCRTEYLNHKCYYSVLLQVVCDDQGKFLDIFVGPPGRFHDARMLRKSPLFGDQQLKMGHDKSQGDGLYFQWISSHVIVENSYDRLKCRLS